MAIFTWFAATFKQYPEIAIFLTLALGYYFGKFTFKGLGLGSVTATLLAGVCSAAIYLTLARTTRRSRAAPRNLVGLARPGTVGKCVRSACSRAPESSACELSKPRRCSPNHEFLSSAYVAMGSLKTRLQ